MVSYVSKLWESWYHSFTGFLTEIIISIEYSENMLLEKMIVTPLENHKKFRLKIFKRSNKIGFVKRILIIPT